MSPHKRARHEQAMEKIKMEALQEEMKRRLNTSIRVIAPGKRLIFIGTCQRCGTKFQIEGREVTKPDENRTRCCNCGVLVEVKLFDV